ncbi:hypothetical protein [Tardiphaga robiniae]|uniref:hypothetical protein n=1 Tax=Tardiphaga robiniae TaxID=943830 RepID=UPI001585FC37|nr:hypothetical protein [Tardiphaga robiniae]NUU40369.1 hypothetical protein [Tardiphaga robiniae]
MPRKTFEREKWEKDVGLRERELAVKEREASAKQDGANAQTKEVAIKAAEYRRSRFTNPLSLAIIGATIAAIGSSAAAFLTARSQLKLEQFKADSALILEVIKSSKDEEAKKNLQFLIAIGAITDTERRKELSSYLDSDAPVPELLDSKPSTYSGKQFVKVKCTIPLTAEVPAVLTRLDGWLKRENSVSGAVTTDLPDGALISYKVQPKSFSTEVLSVTLTVRKMESAVIVETNIALTGLAAAFPAFVRDAVIREQTRELSAVTGGKVLCEAGI